jgi:hypothetical protein
VGDLERERVVASLRRHYLDGRLTQEELEERVGLALRARHRAQLRAASSALPARWRDPAALRDASDVLRRGMKLALIGSVWMVFSSFLALTLAVTALVGDGLSRLDAALFTLVWAALTWACWRAARRA